MTRRAYVLGGILAILAAYLLWSWYGGPAPVSTRDFKTAKTLGQLAGAPSHVITRAKVQVYDKAPAKKRLKIADEEIEGGEEIQNAAEIPAAPAGVKAVVFINASTGKSRISYKANPVPLFSLEKGTELGVRFGITTRGDQAIELFVRRDLARIGKVYVSAYGEASARLGPDPRPEAKAMIEVSGRFHNLPGLE